MVVVVMAARRGTRDGPDSDGPIPTKSTISIELIGTAETAVTAKSEALEPWTGGLAFCATCLVCP